jgi:hypothetical protein
VTSVVKVQLLGRLPIFEVQRDTAGSPSRLKPSCSRGEKSIGLNFFALLMQLADIFRLKRKSSPFESEAAHQSGISVKAARMPWEHKVLVQFQHPRPFSAGRWCNATCSAPTRCDGGSSPPRPAKFDGVVSVATARETVNLSAAGLTPPLRPIFSCRYL